MTQVLLRELSVFGLLLRARRPLLLQSPDRIQYLIPNSRQASILMWRKVLLIARFKIPLGRLECCVREKRAVRLPFRLDNVWHARASALLSILLDLSFIQRLND